MTFVHLLTHVPQHEHGKAMAQDLRSPELDRGERSSRSTIMSMQLGNHVGQNEGGGGHLFHGG